MVSRWSRVKAGCAFALACVLPCAFTPGAFAADDGRWPVVNDTVASAWKQGIDGSGVKVAVLDTQAVEDYPALKDADITYRLGRFSGMDGNEVECKVGGRPLTATIKAGDDGYYSSHGTDMLSWIVGDGGNYTLDKAGMLGAAPKARILHITTMGDERHRGDDVVRREEAGRCVERQWRRCQDGRGLGSPHHQPVPERRS